MKVLLDTNVYIVAGGSADRAERFLRRFLPLSPRMFLSAVVAYELRVDAADRQTRELIDSWITPLRRVGRIVTPEFGDWIEAANIVDQVSDRARSWRSKLPHLLNDVLIALGARRIGATLFTHNRSDFELIRRHREFSLQVLD